MYCRRIGISTLVVALALVPVSAAQAAELVTTTGGENLVVATQGEVTVFPVALYAVGTIKCGAHAGHPSLASIETSYSIVGGEVSHGGLPSDSKRFYRAGTAKPPPRDGCPVTWDTSPVPYQLPASVAISPETPPGPYTVALRATPLAGSGALVDEKPTMITVRVLAREQPAGPPPSLTRPAQPGFLPPPAFGLSRPRENVSLNVLPVRGKVLVRYPGAKKAVLLEGPVQVPVRSKLDTTAGEVKLESDKDGKGGVQRATFWNGRFAVGYTRAVVAGPRGRRQRSRRPASRPITELALAGTCGKGARVASAIRDRPLAHAARRRRGLFGRGRGRFRTRGSNGAGTVRGTHWYTENRCRATFFRVFSGVVDVRDFGAGRTVRLRRKQSYLTGSRR